MKNHDRDIKNNEKASMTKLSKFEEKIHIDDWIFAKNIYRYTRDAFIRWNQEEKRIQLIGGLVSSIFQTNECNIELTKEEIISLLDNNSKMIFEKLINSLDSRNEVNEFILKGTNRDNNIYWFKCILKKDNNTKDGFSYIGILTDITCEKDFEKRCNNIIEYDITTGIPNKYFMKNIINNYLSRCEKCGELGTLFLIDLDDFNFINDIFNHEVGDKLLYLIANELTSILTENSIIGRYSGDEFIIFKPDIKDIEEAEKFAKKIMKVFEEPLNVKGKQLYITASIGIALSPHNGNDFNMLLKSADTAMYSVKKNGKNGYMFFNNGIYTELNRVYTLQRCLKNALKDNELFVLFQPNISLNDSKMHGMEALLRWNSKELGLVSPNEIIPTAEATRLILPIGRFVLEEVFKKVKQLLSEGYDNFKIAVNLSELQLRYNTIIKDLEDLMKKYNVPLKYIEIEITESILMKSFDKNVNILNQIRKLGGSIALDDFGTGYSSLNYLTKLPIDILKVDRSFVIDLMDNVKSRCIVENIIHLSHQLGIEVIAEGVEYMEQVIYLKSIFCDKIQGYYFSKPDHFENIKKLFYKEFICS